MRILICAAAALLGANAWAQPVLDGKATATGAVGDALRQAMDSPGIQAEELRMLMRTMIDRKQPPEDKDLLAELASGAAVQVTMDGRSVRVPALAPDVLAIAKIMSAPPNLNTLWKSHGEPMLQLVEMSRWGDMAKNRVTGFMANNLFAAWTKSNVRTGYREWMAEFTVVQNAMDTIADPAVKTEAKLLLKSAMEQVFAKCQAAGKELPPLFLYDLAFTSVGAPRTQ